MTNSTVSEKQESTKAAKTAKPKAEAAKKTPGKKAPAARKTGITAEAKRKVTTLANKKAKELNLDTSGCSAVEIIRAIQIAEGNFACFGTASYSCDQEGCCWRVLCLSEV